jgi:putative sigma-54 modulation protein
MQLNISGHHVEVTDSLRSYVQSKFDRLSRHVDGMTNVHVILSVEKLCQKADATIHGKDLDLFADAEHEDLYTAIDRLADKLDRQLLKHKEKVKDRSHGH